MRRNTYWNRRIDRACHPRADLRRHLLRLLMDRQNGLPVDAAAITATATALKETPHGHNQNPLGR